MVEGTREVTTYCPRCASPIIWAVPEDGTDVAVPRVSDWACDCELTEEEWATLDDQARTALDEPIAWVA